MRKFIVFSILAIGCVDDSGTVKTLRKAGFTDIKTDGYAFFACSEGDTFSTRFTAKNPRGEVVSGAVCCGFLKNCTIRY